MAQEYGFHGTKYQALYFIEKKSLYIYIQIRALTMRTITYVFTTIGIVLSIWSFTACNQSAGQAVGYNDQVVEIQDALMMSVRDLEQSFDDYEANAMDSCFRQLMTQIQMSKAQLEKLGDFKGDSTLYFAARNVLDEYDALAGSEYAELISFMKIPDSLFTVEDQERSFVILSQVANRRESVFASFVEAQKSFGSDYGFVFDEEIVEN